MANTKGVLVRLFKSPLSTWLLIASSMITVIVVSRSRPFLKLPYDTWHHLMLIRGWFQDNEPILTRPGITYHEVGWHWAWAKLFSFLGQSDVFIWAKIIHCTQLLWALLCCYIFTHSILKLLFRNLPAPVSALMSLASGWLFFVSAGTFSMQYQQSWLLWYSVNYQGFTLPAYFLAVALTLSILAEKNLSKITLGFRAALVLFILLLIIILHPLEAAYYLISFTLLALIFVEKAIKLIRSHPLVLLPFILAVVFSPFLLHFLPEFGIALPQSRGLKLLLEPAQFWKMVLDEGKYIQQTSFHRGLSSFNELAIAGTIICCILAFRGLWRKSSHKLGEPNVQILGWLAAASLLFGLAPRLELLSGFLSVMTGAPIVWRFSFASPGFVALPVLGALLWQTDKRRLGWMLPTLIFSLVILFSKVALDGPTFANAKSLFRMLELRESDSVGIQYPQAALRVLEQRVRLAPLPPTGKHSLFLVRSDLQTYIRAATGAYVLGDRLGPVSRETFDALPDKDNYVLVSLDAPAELAVDEQMRQAFPSMGL